jgi:hypothetical protein
MLLAELEEFWTLHFILENARWAGAPSQKQVKEEYLRLQMWEAVRRLWISADVLFEVLVEIIEIADEENALKNCSFQVA